MSDGACNLPDLQYYMRPNAEHVLDYFHITMRITVLQQVARGLPPPLSACGCRDSRKCETPSLARQRRSGTRAD
jgi:hypothetical protein